MKASHWVPLVLLFVGGGAIFASAQSEAKPPLQGRPDAKKGELVPASPAAVPKGVKAYRNLAYVRAGHERQKLDLYVPEKSDQPLPLIVWIHGGGWAAGSKDNCPPLRQGFTQRGYAVASVGYRLSGNAIFPAQIEDCKAAIRWARAHARQYNLDPQRFGVWGSSAGGHLVALLGTSGEVKAFDVGAHLGVSSRVQAVCDYYGPTDLLQMDAHALPGARLKHDAANSPESRLIGGPIQENKEKTARANPIAYVTPDDPPFLIVHGDADPLVPIHQSQLLFEALQKAGVNVHFHTIKGAGHGQGFGGREIEQMVNAFFDRWLKGNTASAAPTGAIRTESMASSLPLTPAAAPGKGQSPRDPRLTVDLGHGGQPGLTGETARQIGQWCCFEAALTSARDYANPYRDVTLSVTFDGPDGRRFAGYGFWDGGRTFKVRAAFPTSGTWTWRTVCSDTDDHGLHGRSGTVLVVPNESANPLYRHGFIKVSHNDRYLVHTDGTPFLWIGDTPWAACIAATQEEWENYLENRKNNKFTVVQVHCGNEFLKLAKDRNGNPPFLGSEATLRWNPAYWQQVDQKVRAANDRGLLVYICAVRQPGSGFPENDAHEVGLFAKNLTARLMGSFVMYSPVADDLWSPLADVAGQALKQASSIHLVSAHPRFFLDPAITFHGKHYIDVVGLQTGEGWTFDPYKKQKRTPFSTPLAAQNAFEWPLALYQRTPVKPVINQEGPYDHPLESNGRVPLPPRMAGYWSFLSGARGHTYGCFGIWNWGMPIKWFPTYDFQTALNLPSVAHMKYMAEFFSAIRWWTLEPHHELVQNQPTDWMLRIGLAKSASGDLAVAYLPDNTEIRIEMRAFPTAMQAKWFRPTTGEYQTISGTVPATGLHTFARPAGWEDALLVLARSEPGRH